MINYEAVIRDSFSLFSRYFLFILIAIILEFGVFYGITFSTGYLSAFLAHDFFSSHFFLAILINLALGTFDFIFGSFINATLVIHMLNKENQTQARLSQVVLYTLKRLVPEIFTLILMNIVTALGMILLIIPGIIFLIMYSQAPYFALIEGMGPVQSLKASAQLTKGSRMKIFILLLVIGVFYMAFSYAITLLGYHGVVITLMVPAIVGGVFGTYFIVLQYAIWRALRGTL